MDQFAPQPDLTLQLPRDMYYQVIHTLRGAMPPPVTKSPEDLVRRDNAAIAQVACLLPANADEANIAAQYVAAGAQALDCLRLAREFPAGEALILKCSAQAAGMMREARAARSLLMRVQLLRQKREADHTALDQAAWIEHCAINLMADALGRTASGRTALDGTALDRTAPDGTPPAPIAEPPPPMSPPAMSQPATPAVSTPAVSTPAEEPAPPPDPAAEAEQYAIIYPRRAALIRSLGGLPDRPDFGPPAPALVHAIVTGTSPTLRALDRPGAAPITA